MNKEELVKEITDIVKEHWDTTLSALFIADIPTKVRERKGVDYKEVIGDERLKPFVISSAGSESFDVIEHSKQIAKIGLVPHGTEFQFPDEDNPVITQLTVHSLGRSREKTISFLELIDKLPLQEKLSINIPTHIIAKLISDK